MKLSCYIFSLILVLVTASPVAAAEEGVKELLNRVDRLEKEIDSLRKSVGDSTRRTDDSPRHPVVLMLENGVLTPIQPGEGSSERILILKIAVVNLSSERQDVDRSDLSLHFDGRSYPLADIPEDRKNTAFPWGMEYNYLQRVSPFRKLSLPAGGSSNGWIYVPGLPEGNDSPSLELIWKRGDDTQTVDLLAASRTRMDLSVERIGPADSLGLLTIRGEVTGLGALVMVRELEILVKEGCSRVLLAWEPTASQVEPGIGNWLRQAAESEDRAGMGDDRYPTIPSAIRELHIASLPSPDFQPYARNQEQFGPGRRLHADSLTAVRIALREILERVPREELLSIISSDHPLVRSAALAVGSGRLLAEDLAIVMQASDDADPRIQEGAIRGLEHFGEPEAIEKLIFWLQKGTEPLSSIAANSLISSRFPAAQDALLKQLPQESVESQSKLFEQLIKTPRPLLAQPLFDFVSTHPELLTADELRCLEILGHPKLVELLQRGLRSENPGIGNESLRILVARNSADSDEIAVAWTLEKMRSDPPTEQMLLLLKRVKPQAAVELLLKHLPAGGEQLSMIATLGLIADGSVAGRLKELYPNLPTPCQAELLTIFRNWEVPEFRELAQQALASDDPVKVRNAALGLIAERGDRGLPAIGQALEQTRLPEIVQTLADVLSNLGDTQAREILRKVRAGDSEMHRRAAVLALAQIRTRSPGYPLLQQAFSLIDESIPDKDRDYRQAINYLNEAIKLDSELFEAYQSRANCLMHLDKPLEAGPDFRRALEIEPYSPDVVTGLCVVMAAEGQWQEALKRLDLADTMFEKELNYQYNSACVYGRVIAHLRKTQDIPDREKLIETYTASALKRLRASVESGFEDFNWMQRDPDLESLRDTEGFKQILNEKGANTPPAGPRA